MNLTLAWRNIWRNKTRSLIIMASVAIGLVAGLFVLGLYEGMLKARVRTVIDLEIGHLQIHHPRFLDDYEATFHMNSDSLRKLPGEFTVIKHIALRTVTQGMLATTTGTSGVQVNGVTPEDENLVSQLDKKLIEGEGLASGKRNPVVIGKKLAEKMKLKVGNKLVLTFTDSESNITSGAFRVTGIYQTINTPLDEVNVFIHQSVLNNYLNIGEGCHEVAIILQQDEDLPLAKRKIQQLLPQYKVRTWDEISPETKLMVTTTDQFSLIIIAIIMIALAFGIINTMLMSVLERTREIGMLSALGMNRRKVFSLILSETVLLTVVGTPLGLFISWLLLGHFGRVGIDISSFSGAAMSGFGFSSMIYPQFPITKIIPVMLIVISTALVAALFPSLKAIKLQPADALRQ